MRKENKIETTGYFAGTRGQRSLAPCSDSGHSGHGNLERSARDDGR